MKEGGFTLIEVLAALLIFSVAIIGLTHAGTESARAVTAIDDKMLAGIMADNQLIRARARNVEEGIIRGQERAMSREFSFELETVRTDIAGFHRLIVKVRAKDRDQVIVERTAFHTGWK